MINLLHLKNTPILKQLRIEEALLRTHTGNWCIINEGSPLAIVMGISGKLHELIDAKKANKTGVPLIRRFSGGGTVVVDENTLFVSFIFDRHAHAFEPFPEPIHRWAETFYKKVFDHLEFALRENDYVLGERKCGGNAQYLRKDRWLHHTTFLWDFENAHMDLLLHPPKAPTYRAKRSHSEFLTPLKNSFASLDALVQRIKNHLGEAFQIRSYSIEEINLDIPHRKATTIVEN